MKEVQDDEIELVRSDASIRNESQNAISSIISDRRKRSKRAQAIRVYFTFVVLVSIYMLCVRGIPALAFDSGKRSWWFFLESFVNLNFMLEYFIRLATCQNIMEFMKRPTSMIDFLSFIPYFTEIFVFVNLKSDDDLLKNQYNIVRIVGLLNLLRLVKLFRLSMHHREIRMFVVSIWNSVQAIIFLLLFWVCSGLFFGNMAYYIETSYCTYNAGKWYYKDMPGTPAVFQNVGDALWWCFVTMATVGYGDIVPQTNGGKIIATMVMITSFIFLGLPTTIFGANLSELYAQYRVAQESDRKLKIRRQSSRKNETNIEMMVQDLEAEITIIKANLERLTETHRGIIHHLKESSKD